MYILLLSDHGPYEQESGLNPFTQNFQCIEPSSISSFRPYHNFLKSELGGKGLGTAHREEGGSAEKNPLG